jgi:hypothetical protein
MEDAVACLLIENAFPHIILYSNWDTLGSMVLLRVKQERERTG